MMRKLKLFEMEELVTYNVDRIGRVFPKGKLTLLAGLPGSGKSVSTLRELNRSLEIPIYFNLDHTFIDDDIEVKMYSEKELTMLFDKDIEFEDISGSVIVIDTYTRLKDMLVHMAKEMSDKTTLDDTKIVKLLEWVSSRYDATVIVLGHPTDYVGKDGIFKDNEQLVRNAYEYLYLEKKINSSTKTNKTTGKKETEYSTQRVLHVNKGRGYSGEFILKDFGNKFLDSEIEDIEKMIDFVNNLTFTSKEATKAV